MTQKTPEGWSTLTIDANSFKELKTLYNTSVADKAEQFTFQGKEILTAYAKYMIEYLEMQKAQGKF